MTAAPEYKQTTRIFSEPLGGSRLVTKVCWPISGTAPG
jgi:hypothetical protein